MENIPDPLSVDYQAATVGKIAAEIIDLAKTVEEPEIAQILSADMDKYEVSLHELVILQGLTRDIEAMIIWTARAERALREQGSLEPVNFYPGAKITPRRNYKKHAKNLLMNSIAHIQYSFIAAGLSFARYPELREAILSLPVGQIIKTTFTP